MKYKPEYSEQVYRLAKLGLTDVMMAEAFGVQESTFNNWKKKPEFMESLKRGRIDPDVKVAESLYERATGFVTREDRLIDGKVVTLERQHPPDTTAAIFWLKNRRPDLWRDRKELDHTTKGDKLGDALSEKSFDELYELKYGHKPTRQSD